MTNPYIEQLKKSNKTRQQQFYDALDDEKNRFKDNRIWTPTLGPDKTAHAVIRFLPPRQDEKEPFVKYWDHYFQGPGGIYFERSLRTFGKKDPAQAMVAKLWATEDPASIKLARERGARFHAVSNILVIEDKQVPENNGKVFLYRYGKKVWNKIEAASQAVKPIDAFNLWAPSSELSKKDCLAWAEKNGNPGANFVMDIKVVGGYNNYDDCNFDEAMSLCEYMNVSEDQEGAFIEKIMNQAYALNEFLDPKLFKSHEELVARLAEVLNEKPGSSNGVKTLADKIAAKPKLDMGDGLDEPPFDIDDNGSFNMSDFEKLLER